MTTIYEFRSHVGKLFSYGDLTFILPRITDFLKKISFFIVPESQKSRDFRFIKFFGFSFFCVCF
jgi:hypothetical protein